ncbi:MAG: hypothetical protein E7559_06415 [Ruminococcaceae bacterium]|nr:hypothetical protein [Oscillospiraceae bacterium]
MSFFEGSICGVCSNRFTDSDDVVACPVCGAPHHRACWAQSGQCCHEEQHGDGFVWQRETETPGSEAENVEESTVRCPVCGMINSAGRLHCQNCTAALYSNMPKGDVQDTQPGAPQGGDGSFAFGMYVSPVNDGDLIDDIPVGDYKRFLGPSSFIFIPTFMHLAQGKGKIKFNLFAMFMHGIWFISRKMYILGGALLTFMLGIFAFVTSCYDIMEPALEAYAANDIMPMMMLIQERPLLMFTLIGLSVLQFAVYILCGLFANRIYFNWCKKRIREINKSSHSAEHFNRSLEEAGGQSLLPALAALAIYFVAERLIQYWLM